ncbi:MAG: hypothetical protein PHO71_08420, partial [Bacteroides sp.]|nr:hypothetical protein [Bacteroides sp.]
MANIYSTPSDYWIKPGAFTISLNALDNPQYLQASVLSGAVIMAYKSGVIGYDSSHNYRKWNLEAYNNLFDNTSAKFIYARLDREEDSNQALIVYSPEKLDIVGKIENDENSVEDTCHFFIYLGSISSSVNKNGESIPRIWDESYNSGTLATDQAIREESKTELSKMFRLNEITGMIDVFKTISEATINIVRIGKKLILGGKEITDVKRSTDSEDDVPVGDDNLTTSKYVSKTIKECSISKINDDKAAGHITFEQGIHVKGGTVGDGQSILEDQNSILEEGNGIIEESLSAPAPVTSTLGGLDNVNDIVDIPSNKDVVLVKKAGSLEWTQEDKTVNDTIPEAPKDGKQYARQDGGWSEVKDTPVDMPTKISQLENDANYIQDAHYIHTDNNFTTALKNQLSDLNSEFLNTDNKNNYVKARRFFAKAFENIDAPWGFMRYLNNTPELTATTVKVTAIRSDFNGNPIDNSYVTISAATQSLAGIMTAADKKKLDGIAEGATKVIIDSALSATSLNPVQNKVISSSITTLGNRTTVLENNYSTLNTNFSPIKNAFDKRGTKDGFLILGDNGIISSQFLPSYVDDVLEVYATYDKSATGVLSNIKLYTNSTHTTAVVPETGKIYIDITTGKPPYQFRWSGTTYIDLNTGGLILGTITGTAYDGGEGSKNRAAINSLPDSLIT